MPPARVADSLSTHSFPLLCVPAFPRSGIVGDTTPLTLDASRSVDPSGSPLQYSWSCVRVDTGAGCTASNGGAVNFTAAAVQTLTLRGSDTGALVNYTVTVRVTAATGAAGRNATASTTISVRRGRAPVVAIQGLATSAVLPSQKLALYGQANTSTSSPPTVQWNVTAGPSLNLTAAALTPLTGATLVLAPNTLAPGASYTFRLTATDQSGSGFAEIRVAVAQPPRYTGNATEAVAVSPRSGYTLNTTFLASPSPGWVGDSLPLSYSFAYLILGDPNATLVPMGQGTTLSTTPLQLPAGVEAGDNRVLIAMRVTDALGATSGLFNTTVTVTVNTEQLKTAEGATSLLTSASSSAQALVSQGKASSALQVASSLASLMNTQLAATSTTVDQAVVSTLQASLQTARAALVDTVTSIVSSGAASSSTAGAETVALTLKSIVSVPEQVTPAARAAALNSTVAIAGAGGVVSQTAGNAVINVLDSLVQSEALDLATPSRRRQLLQSTGGATACPTTAKVPGILSSLAGSLSGQLSAPEEKPVGLASANIQLAVGLNSASDSSRLFSSNITVAGSPTAFAPMPAGVFAAAGNDTRAGVSSVFHNLNFDPYTCGGNDTVPVNSGVARLAFSTPSGKPLTVANLTKPILFTIPSGNPKPNTNSSAVCSFWNETLKAYSSVGCSGAPNPLPANVTAFVSPNFTTTTDAGMLRAWTLRSVANRSSVADGCTATVLECPRDIGKSVFVNPMDPLRSDRVRDAPGARPPVCLPHCSAVRRPRRG